MEEQRPWVPTVCPLMGTLKPHLCFKVPCSRPGVLAVFPHSQSTSDQASVGATDPRVTQTQTPPSAAPTRAGERLKVEPSPLP